MATSSEISTNSPSYSIGTKPLKPNSGASFTASTRKLIWPSLNTPSWSVTKYLKLPGSPTKSLVGENTKSLSSFSGMLSSIDNEAPVPVLIFPPVGNWLTRMVITPPSGSVGILKSKGTNSESSSSSSTFMSSTMGAILSPTSIESVWDASSPKSSRALTKTL